MQGSGVRDQIRHQPSLPAALLCLIQTELNKNLLQALKRRNRVCWADFDSIRRALVTSNFFLEIVMIPGALVQPQTAPYPPPEPATATSKTQRLYTPNQSRKQHRGQIPHSRKPRIFLSQHSGNRRWPPIFFFG